ncbi:MAG: glutaminyl-tRNA synthase (glutamine-hydrolyzing) subunit B [Omnitrophica WOR_2 bacterium RIFCSPHIGHO2_02_FULL_67_20]|nr:MAG: glutaminyl-tRNA synthase (glutamine-hydrolyzing) subunit B [Omnitrophica WOR_2 bacterium RIFCSPHIGHO2_02_FULL_67_20]
MSYEPVIGLEVHLQLSTSTKLFCGCLAKYGAAPNSQTCPVCLGLPGVLPVLNERVMEWGIRVALAVDCQIAQTMKFDRKQYFYPDLPKNYQISQYDRPLAQRGHLDIVADHAPKRIGITRIHLEEDAGKLLHEASQTESYVDFNRTGVPLLEIVSEPDLRSPEEAYQYLIELKAIIEYLAVSTCNMEEGSLRCDTNVSLRRPGASQFGAKVEVKNLNSFKAVKQALAYEIQRQAVALDQGQRIRQETRLWDARALRTEPMRSKEGAADYRYFPEPDLVPFVIDRALIARMKATLPELPAERRRRYQDAYQLSAYDAQVLTQHAALGELFEGALRCGAPPKPAANWIMGDYLAHLNAKNREPESEKLRPEWLAHLIQLVDDGTISGKMAKDLFVQTLERGEDPRRLVEEGGLKQIVDAAALEPIADEVLRKNQRSVEDYLKGKTTAFTHLMGQAMKLSKGKANPQQMAALLKRKLEQVPS